MFFCVTISFGYSPQVTKSFIQPFSNQLLQGCYQLDPNLKRATFESMWASSHQRKAIIDKMSPAEVKRRRY